jgi:hypothetical protein
MKKTTPTPRNEEIASPWDDVPVTPEAVAAEPVKQTRAEVIAKHADTGVEFDMEGLMTDFPTAKELERFVYDQTGRVLNLKGRANKLKYQVAMDVLNGKEVDPVFVGGDNPYIERADMVPVEDIRPAPPRDSALPDHEHIQNQFVSRLVPHPDPDMRATDRKVDCVFRKYRNGMISYEVLGPIDQRPEGEKMDKFGRIRPEIIRWIDPRTGEQCVVRKDGTLTPMGRNLKAMMQKIRFNDSNWWDVFVDREFADMVGGELNNPWDVRE